MHWTFGPARPSRRSRLWAALFTPSLLFFSAPVAQAAPPAPTVVLVHGAWADGSTWREVIVRLQARGLHVVAVQNQLNSLADDAAAVARALEPITAPVVLVGHSWGGTVITQAGVSNKVVALVYVAAFAPDVGESTNDLQANAPPPGYVPLLQLDSAGYLWFPQAQMPQWFAQDLPAPGAALIAAAQNPIRATAFGDKVDEAAWRSKPSWYLLTTRDRMIAPELQRQMSARMQAAVRTVDSSHVPFASQPRETTAVILEAVEHVLHQPTAAPR